MKKFTLYILVFLALASGSCNDFLNPQPAGQIPEKDAFTKLSDCQATMNGIYAIWNTSILYSGNLTLIPDLQCDMAYPVVGFMGDGQAMFEWSYTPITGETMNIFYSLYRINNTVNFLLENYHKAVIKEEEKEELNNILAAAYFSRALAMCELVKYYAPAYDPANAANQPGVPIQDKANDNTVKPARASLAQNYTHILEDLALATKLCTLDEADAIYITKGAIDALFARVYLYMENWNEAAKAAGRVISNKKYALADATAWQGPNDPSSPFTMMWWFDQGNEIIWKLKYTTTDYPGALGKLFNFKNGAEYKIEYAPSQVIVNMYETSAQVLDCRLPNYFASAMIENEETIILNKYPGNQQLESGSPLYANMPKVFRLAEMYLIRAEAYARMSSPQTSLANADLHFLRGKRIINYTKKDLSGKQLTDAIKTERVKELIMEGHRFYDLKRYKEGFTRKPQYLSIAPNDALSIKPDNNRWIWPIPKHEVDANPNVQQNPGY